MDSTFLCGLSIQRQLEKSQVEEREETGRCCADQWDQTTLLVSHNSFGRRFQQYLQN